WTLVNTVLVMRFLPRTLKRGPSRRSRPIRANFQQCLGCGNELNDLAKYCPRCGSMSPNARIYPAFEPDLSQRHLELPNWLPNSQSELVELLKCVRGEAAVYFRAERNSDVPRLMPIVMLPALRPAMNRRLTADSLLNAATRAVASRACGVGYIATP